MVAAHARRFRAAIACATILILVAGGALLRHHEAEVSHVTDARTGITSHAIETDCHDAAPAAHLHGLPGYQHADDCGLTKALHQTTRVASPPAIVTVVPSIERADAPPIAVVSSTSLLRTAPKTSPPVRA